MTNYDILPREQRLETKTEESLDGLVEIIDASYDKTNGFIGENSIVHHPEMADLLIGIASILSDETPGKEAKLAVKQGFTFAIEVCKLLQPATVALNIDFPSYFKDIPTAQLRETIEDDVSLFLDSYPAVDRLISLYITKLDPTHVFTSETYTATALTMMQVELSNSKQYMDNVIAFLDDNYYEGRN